MNRQPVYAEILLCTYNGEKYIRAQIDSILAQKDTRWHLTVSDDGSTDGTVAILDEYVARYPHRIRRYVSGRRFGNARDHFFHLMEHCEVPYMLFCDQDDVWYRDKVGRVLTMLREIERVHGEDCPALAFTDQTPTDENLNPLAQSLMAYHDQHAEEIDYRAILLQNIVTGGAMGVNAAAAKMAARVRDRNHVIMHDWWLAAVAARFGEVRFIDESLSDYRQHGHNNVGAKNVQGWAYIAQKLSHLREVRRTIVLKKEQAAQFYSTYRRWLDDEDERFLLAFARSHSGPGFYLRHMALIHGLFRKTGFMLLG